MYMITPYNSLKSRWPHLIHIFTSNPRRTDTQKVIKHTGICLSTFYRLCVIPSVGNSFRSYLRIMRTVIDQTNHHVRTLLYQYR
jgi:hypothetical protein